MRDDSAFEAALGRVMGPREAKAAAERIARRLEQRTPAPRPPGSPSVAPTWSRIAALACAAVLGISIGFSGIGSRIAAELDLVRTAAADEGPSTVFDLDVGIRP